MNNLVELSEEEIDQLDQFLLNRFDEDADTEGKDDGILIFSELEGLLTAIVSGPVLIQPSQWLPAVWGDFEPKWDSEKEFEIILSLMIRLMNSIVSTLMDQPKYFEPTFLERKVPGKSNEKDKTYLIVDDWCEGYCKGVSLAEKQWQEGGREMLILLMPIRSFTSVLDWCAHDYSDAEVDNIRNAIVPNVCEIHAYWLSRREKSPPVQAKNPVRRSEVKVGRNEACPCGSGKKYKKCCLH